MAHLKIEFSSNRDYCGCLILSHDRGRIICGPWPVAGRATDSLAELNGNPQRYPIFRYGDTPLGTYRVTQVLKSGRGTAFNAEEFGPHGIIVMQGISDDAAIAEANGRFHVLITGGTLSSTGQLRSTAGALRLTNKHQQTLVAELRRLDELEVAVFERKRTSKMGKVHVCPLLLAQDPPSIPLELSPGRKSLTPIWLPASARVKAPRSSAPRAIVFGFAVTFVALHDAASAHSVGELSTKRGKQNQPQVIQQLSSSPAPVKLAYNESFSDSEFRSIINPRQEVDTDKYVSQLGEIWSHAKPLEETRDTTIEVLKDMTKKMGEVAEKNNFKGAFDYFRESDSEFVISKYSVASQALEGVGSALAVKHAWEIGQDVGNAINDLNTGKISTTDFVAKVGPAPAKLLLTAVGVPFADQWADTAIVSAQHSELLNSMMDPAVRAGMEMYDKYSKKFLGGGGK
jgi:hypothetical protein